GEVQEEFELDPELLSILCRRGRRRLRLLQLETRANIWIDRGRGVLHASGPEAALGELQRQLASLRGPRKNVSAAVWSELMRTRTNSKDPEEGLVARLQQESGCRIHIERDRHQVRIFGPSDEVRVCERLIEVRQAVRGLVKTSSLTAELADEARVSKDSRRRRSGDAEAEWKWMQCSLAAWRIGRLIMYLVVAAVLVALWGDGVAGRRKANIQGKDFAIFAPDSLSPSDHRSLRQARFLLQQELGSLSARKSIKSAQVKAGEAGKKLKKAQQDAETKGRLAAEALLEAVKQNKYAEQLELELREAVAKAKQEMEQQERQQDGGAVPGAVPQPSEVRSLVDKRARLAKLVETKIEGADLGEAGAALKELLSTLADDKFKVEEANDETPPVPAPATPRPEAASQPGAAAGSRDDAIKPEDFSEFSSATLDAAMEEFGGDCPDKRRLLEQFTRKTFKIGVLSVNTYANIDKCLGGSLAEYDTLLFQEARLPSQRTVDAEVSNELEVASRMEYPISRLRALRGLRNLLAKPPKLVKVEPAAGDAGCVSPKDVPLVSSWWHALSNLRIGRLDLDVVSQLAHRTKQEACRMADHDMYVRRAEFNDWVERQARGGGGGLHALTKVPAGGKGRRLAVHKVARSGLGASASYGFVVTGCSSMELDKLRTLVFTSVANSTAGRSRSLTLMLPPGLRSDAGQDWASVFNDLLGEVTDSDSDVVADGAPVAEAPPVGSSISAPLVRQDVPASQAPRDSFEAVGPAVGSLPLMLGFGHAPRDTGSGGNRNGVESGQRGCADAATVVVAGGAPVAEVLLGGSSSSAPLARQDVPASQAPRDSFEAVGTVVGSLPLMLGFGHAPRDTGSGGSNGVESGQRGCADAATVVSKMVAIRLTANEKGYLDSLVQGGQWSQAREHEKGYATAPECLRCGQLGTLYHRHCEDGNWPDELVLPKQIELLAQCRWYDRRSECPVSIVPTVLELNSKLDKKHVLVELAPVRSSELVKDMAFVACLVCGASAAARPSTFKKECGHPGSKGKAVLSRLEKKVAPTISAKVVVSMKMLGADPSVFAVRLREKAAGPDAAQMRSEIAARGVAPTADDEEVRALYGQLRLAFGRRSVRDSSDSAGNRGPGRKETQRFNQLSGGCFAHVVHRAALLRDGSESEARLAPAQDWRARARGGRFKARGRRRRWPLQFKREAGRRDFELP
ncbi:unnamed protein product, partial [Prorocentrum cordatum]